MDNVRRLDPDAKQPHLVCYEKCKSCGFKSVVVATVGVDVDAMECGGCGKMTSRLVTKIGTGSKAWHRIHIGGSHS